MFGQPNSTPYVKDGINDYIVNGRAGAVNPAQTGTKVAVHYPLSIEPGATSVLRLRLTDVAPDAISEAYLAGGSFGTHLNELFQTRRQEANAFSGSITPTSCRPTRPM